MPAMMPNQLYDSYLEFSHGLLNGSLGVHTVHVVQVNVISVQPLEGGFACFSVSRTTDQQSCTSLLQEQVIRVAVSMQYYYAVSLSIPWHSMAARISCAYMAAHLTYFRLPSIAMPPSLVNLIANFVQSWAWSRFPFSARPVSRVQLLAT